MSKISRFFDLLVVQDINVTSKDMVLNKLIRSVVPKGIAPCSLDEFSIIKENNEITIQINKVKAKCYKENGEWFESDGKNAEQIYNTDIIEKLEMFIRKQKLEKLLQK